MINIIDASKKYKSFFALKNVNLNIDECLVYAFIGPNGSGKTTLLNIILNICFWSKGRTHFKNLKPTDIGSSIGSSGFFESLSIKRNLEIINCIRNSSIEENDFYLNLFGLYDVRHKAIKKLSAGMKQKVSLIAAFLGNPKMIILDEPGSNLDIDAQIVLENMIVNAKNKGTTVIFTSHILSAIEKNSDQIYFMKNGEIVSSDTIENYRQKYQSLENAYKNIII